MRVTGYLLRRLGYAVVSQVGGIQGLVIAFEVAVIAVAVVAGLSVSNRW